jgi:hypothetical protein
MGDLYSVLTSTLHEQSDGALLAVEGIESGVLFPENGSFPAAGELSDINRRKSV